MPSFTAYEPSVLADLSRRIKPPQSFLSQMFKSRPQDFHTSRRLELQLQTGGGVAAPYCRVTSAAIPMAGYDVTTRDVVVPHIRVKRSLAAVDALYQGAGEGVQSFYTPTQRAQMRLVEDMEILSNAIENAKEIQASQIVTTGKVVIKGHDIDAEIDYGRNPAHSFTLAGATRWNQATGVPSADFKNATRLISQNGLATCDMVIMGGDAFEAFISNPAVFKDLDNRRLDPGSTPRTTLSPVEGARYQGRIYGLDIWVYEQTLRTVNTEGLLNPTSVALIPQNMVVFMASLSDNRVHFAPVMEIDNCIAIDKFYKMVKHEDPSSRDLIMTSSPLMVPHNPDAFVAIQVY